MQDRAPRWVFGSEDSVVQGMVPRAGDSRLLFYPLRKAGLQRVACAVLGSRLCGQR